MPLPLTVLCSPCISWDTEGGNEGGVGDMGGELLIEFEAAGGAALLVVWHAFLLPPLRACSL